MNDIVLDTDALAQKIPDMFVAFDKESLIARPFLKTVGRLVKGGLLEERGNDSYAPNSAGYCQDAAARQSLVGYFRSMR